MATLHNLTEEALSVGFPATDPLLPGHFTISGFVDGTESVYLLRGEPTNPNSAIVARIEQNMDGTAALYKGNGTTGGTYSGTVISGFNIVFMTVIRN